MGNHYPGFWLRSAAAYLNLAILLALLFTAYSLLGNKLSLEISFLVILIFSIINIIWQANSGFNFGRFLLGHKLVHYRDEDKHIGFRRSLSRTLLAALSIIPLGVGFIASAFNPQKRSLHDLFTNTVVVSEEKTVPVFIQKIMALFFILVAIGINLGIPALIAFSAYSLTNNYMTTNKIASYSSELFLKNPKTSTQLKMQNHELIALAQFKDAKYISFNLDSSSNKNYISKNQLEALNYSLVDIDYKTDFERIRNFDFEKSIVIPKITFKDKQGFDLNIHNLEFIITEDKNILGRDFLNLFNYQIDYKSNLIYLKLYKAEQEILADDELSEASKAYLQYALNLIRKRWLEYQDYLPTDLLAELSLKKSTITNELEIEIETRRGYITGAVINEPSNNEKYNQFCKDFISNFERFLNIPTDLREAESIILKFNLSYSAA